MTKSFKTALMGATALGARPGPDTQALKTTEVDGVPFEEWLLAAAQSKDGVTHLAIQRAAGQGLIATRPYCAMLAEANGLRLVIEGGTADDGSSNNAIDRTTGERQRYRARFYFVKPEVEAKLPVMAGRAPE